MTETINLALFERAKMGALSVVHTYFVSFATMDSFQHANVQAVRRWDPNTAALVVKLAARAFGCDAEHVVIVGVLDTGSRYLGPLPMADEELCG